MKKPIIEAPGYYITDTGDVFNSDGLKMKWEKLYNGYFRVEMRTKGVSVKARAHRLVAAYFVSNPDNKPMVNHIDGNKSNNHFANLEWVTNSENMIHAIKLGLRTYDKRMRTGGFKPKRAITQTTLNGELVSNYNTIFEARRATGIQMSGALSGRYKTAGGFKWAYSE